MKRVESNYVTESGKPKAMVEIENLKDLVIFNFHIILYVKLLL